MLLLVGLWPGALEPIQAHARVVIGLDEMGESQQAAPVAEPPAESLSYLFGPTEVEPAAFPMPPVVEPTVVPSPTAVPDVGPKLLSEMHRPVPASRGGVRQSPDISTPDLFIAVVAEAARESQLDSKVPASVTIAQAILESDWGKSLLSKKGQNYFGIKAISGPGTAGVISMKTWEVFGGRDVVIDDAFKAYNNIYESVLDHGRFLVRNSRYLPAFEAPNDPDEFARRIHAAGYATDPGYSAKLINLMKKYNLYNYDLALPLE